MAAVQQQRAPGERGGGSLTFEGQVLFGRAHLTQAAAAGLGRCPLGVAAFLDLFDDLRAECFQIARIS
jgi:hypothetical protein